MKVSKLEKNHVDEAVSEFSSEAIAAQFINSLKTSKHNTWPYDHWWLTKAINDSVLDKVLSLPFPQPEGMDFGGRREINNKLRSYFTPKNQADMPICKAIADAFKSKELIRTIEKTTKADLTGGQLRIEYCQDTDGFWLEPHVDISVKLFSMSIYLSDEPDLAHAGTDIYDDTPEHKLVATSPYNKGAGMIFIPSHNTWHGFSKREIKGVRRSLIINYVTHEWKATEELA